ncbi:MAG: YjjW family glycine radical enzyme activase [Acidimicrobiia bacterium]
MNGATLVHPLDRPLGGAFEVAGVVRSSMVDGPGNRYVLFLQGCNFDCAACHNPSTIGRCDGCGVCVEVCPHAALSIPVAGSVAFDGSCCDQCGDCRTGCPLDADPTIALMSVDDVVADLRRVSAYLNGITVSGGEPTLQLPSVTALFARLRADPILSRLTTLVDSNGSLAAAGWRRLIPVLDGAMVDLKAGTPELHRRLARHEQLPVIDSMRLLRRARKLTEVRLLVIEGVTDTPEELEAWASIVASVDPAVPVRLMAFRHTGTRRRAREWPETSPEALARVASTLRSHGLSRVS